MKRENNLLKGMFRRGRIAGTIHFRNLIAEFVKE